MVIDMIWFYSPNLKHLYRCEEISFYFIFILGKLYSVGSHPFFNGPQLEMGIERILLIFDSDSINSWVGKEYIQV